MTWFGILLLVWYGINIGVGLIKGADGGYYVSGGSLLFSAFIVFPLIVLGVLFVGTGSL
jgi:hypothetical protein